MLTAIRQIRDILSPWARRRVWILVGLMVIGTLLESLSVGLVVPVLAVLADPQWLDQTPAVRGALTQLGADTPNRIALLAMGTLVAAYTLKTGFAATLSYLETRLAFATQAQLSDRLFEGYLRQPWTFHLQHNSADLIRNVSIEPHRCGQFLLNALHLASETLIVVVLAGILIVVEPVGALVALVTMGSAAMLFQLATRQRIQRWGERRRTLDGGRLRQLQQGLGAAKEIRLLGREEHLCRSFSEQSRGLVRVLQRQQFVGQLPRLWLELVAVVGVAALVIALVVQDKTFVAALPALGLFAAAAFRLLPSLSRVLGSLQTMRFCAPSLRAVQRELQKTAPLAKAAPRPGPPEVIHSIIVRDLAFRYPDSPRDVLHSVNFQIEAGKSLGIMGPSGVGKSTLVDLILGLLPPSKGQVLVNGRDIHQNIRAWQGCLGYVPQSIYLNDDTIRRNIALGLADREIDDSSVWRSLRDAQLDEFVKSLPTGLDTITGERGIRLSGGQRQRIGIARALYHNPGVLVLDEATSALDNSTENEVMRAVVALQSRKIVIVVAHRLTTVAACDYVYRIEDGTAHHDPALSRHSQASQ